MIEYKEFDDLIWNKEYDKIKELVNSDLGYLELEDNYKRRPLFHIVDTGVLDMVKFFVEKGADINHVGQWGDTAIYKAASSGYIDIFKYLLEQGADINIKSQYGRTMLERIVIAIHNAKSLDLALNRESENNKEFDDLIISVIDKLNTVDSAISTLLNKNKISSFKYAMESGKVSKDSILSSLSSLFSHEDNNGIELLEYLLDNNFLDINDKNSRGESLFQLLAMNTFSTQALQLLVDRGVSINQDENSHAILSYASKDFKKGIEFLIDKLGVDVNYIDIPNSTNALHREANRYIGYSGEKKLSKSFVYLVEKGCDLTLLNNSNDLPLNFLFNRKRKLAVKYAFDLTVKALLEKINHDDKNDEVNKSVFEGFFSIMEIAPTKKEKELLVKSFMNFPEYSARFVEVINDDKLKIRDMAIKTLISFDKKEHLFSLRDRAGVEANRALLNVLNTYITKNKSVLDSLESNKVTRNPKDFKKNSMEYFDVVAENEEGNIPVSWLKINELPDVLWKKTDEKMDKVTVKYFLKLLKDNKVPAPFMKLINSNSVVELFNILHKMPKKLNKDDIWIYNILFMLAEDDVAYLNMICEKIDKFVAYSRWALGASLFTPMADMKNPIGVKKVDWYERKVKHQGVNGRAYSTLRRKASSLNMTLEEFKDTLVSDFGFNNDKELVLDYGTRKITVKLMPDFKYTFKNEDGKVFKTLPKPNKKDKEKVANKSIKFFKEMKKEIRDILKIQKERIEAQLKRNTLKEFAKWESFYVKNPVLNIFASNLFWGIYDDKNKLKKVFRYNEDHSFSDINDDEITFKKTDKVGLVHPVELKEKELNQLKELIEDYELIQPLEQIARKFFTTDSKEKELTDFENLKLYTKSSHYKLLSLGWGRGYIVDNGWFVDYSMMGATLEFSGADMYLEYGDETVTWGKVKFGKALNRVDKRTYSEVYRALDIASQTRVE